VAEGLYSAAHKLYLHQENIMFGKTDFGSLELWKLHAGFTIECDVRNSSSQNIFRD